MNTTNPWIVTAAWPTINHVPHLGTVLHLLSADAITRYLRLLGEDVIAVSGSDAHGTPVLLAAEAVGKEPSSFARDLHQEFLDILRKWRIEFDNYTITTNEIHQAFVQEFYSDLFGTGSMQERSTEQYYCTICLRFLPDRFVVGTCPICSTDSARGDQCSNDNCGVPLTPFDIINPLCTVCNSKPKKKETTHWNFKLGDYSESLLKFLDSSSLLIPDTFRREATAFVKRGLDERAVTRDLSWGIAASEVFDSEVNKVFYVWSEDVLGYISASIPVYKSQRRDWKEIWSKAKTVYCVGKDNLFFHAIWLPALQFASSKSYVPPTVLSITNFIQFNGQGFSKSKSIGIWADEALDKADPDYWRFFLLLNRPENKDSNFTWEGFIQDCNKHLADTIGNLVVRTVTLIHRFNQGKIEPVAFSGTSGVFFDEAFIIEEEIIKAVYRFELKTAVEKTLEFARLLNNFIQVQEPWKLTDQVFLKEILFTSYLGLVRLSEWLTPIIPSFAAAIQKQLGSRNFDWCDIKSSLPDNLPSRSFFVQKLDLNKVSGNS